jgi:hypothetical protein
VATGEFMKCFILIFFLLASTSASADAVQASEINWNTDGFSQSSPTKTSPTKSILPLCSELKDIKASGLPGVNLHHQYTACIGESLYDAAENPPHISDQLKQLVAESETLIAINALVEKYPVLKLAGIITICQPSGKITNPTGVRCRYTTRF